MVGGGREFISCSKALCFRGNHRIHAYFGEIGVASPADANEPPLAPGARNSAGLQAVGRPAAEGRAGAARGPLPASLGRAGPGHPALEAGCECASSAPHPHTCHISPHLPPGSPSRDPSDREWGHPHSSCSRQGRPHRVGGDVGAMSSLSKGRDAPQGVLMPTRWGWAASGPLLSGGGAPHRASSPAKGAPGGSTARGASARGPSTWPRTAPTCPSLELPALQPPGVARTWGARVTLNRVLSLKAAPPEPAEALSLKLGAPGTLIRSSGAGRRGRVRTAGRHAPTFCTASPFCAQSERS